MRFGVIKCIAIIIIFYGCKENDSTKLTFVLKAAFNRKFEIAQIPFNDEKQIMVASGIAKSNIDSFYYELPKTEDHIYQISIEGKNFQIPFVNDSKKIRIACDYGKNKYDIQFSPASINLKKNNDERLQFATKAYTLNLQLDSLKKNNLTDKKIAAINKVLDSLSQLIYQHNLNFADTVQNPAVFMAAYNLVDFGKNHVGLKKFMQHAALRFPQAKAVQLLATNTFDFLKIFEEEYQVGDILPKVVLPNQFGDSISTYSIKNKFILLDFWSTWCQGCKHFSDIKKIAKLKFDNTQFDMISVAIDTEKDTWQNILKYENYNWPQLIDEKMWNGVAIKTLKFDSIPFNFLVDKNNRIVAKAIPADSLIITLSKYIKK